MGAPVKQMFERMLEITSGYVPLYTLEKRLKLDADLLAQESEVPAGRCVHIQADGTWGLGATGRQMPHWLWQGSQDPDVYNNGVSPVSDVTHWLGISPTGVMRGIPATAGIEIQTTEYDTAQNYAANDVLKSDTDGKLTNQSVVVGTNLVVGICSWGENADVDTDITGPENKNAHGVTVLTLYPLCQLPNG